ncbi:hypothetical protein BJP32_01455 [Brevundimonas sp. ZS04]|nr:hypothetical protein BJP32_01455 [Brevundimonas sp. ZS04]
MRLSLGLDWPAFLFGPCLALAISALAGCARSTEVEEPPRCAPGARKIDGGTIEVCGQLTPDVIDGAIALIDDDTRSIRVSSPGGSGVDAIRLSEQMIARNLRLDVVDICASACAHFLFLPAPAVSVEDQSVVLLHHTDFALVSAAEASGLKAAAETQRRAERQRAFFVARGLPIALLTDAFVRTEPVCIGQTPDQRLFAMTRLRTHMPTVDMVNNIRAAAVDGYWPKNAAEAGPIVETFAPEAVPLVYGGEGLIGVESLPSLPICDETHGAGSRMGG